MKKDHKQSHRRIWRRLKLVNAHLRLAWEAFCRLPALARWPVRQVFLKQIYFTGAESLLTVGLVAFLTGLIVVTEINNLVGRNELLTIQVMVWAIMRELGPLLTVMVIIGRSSSALASELSTMLVNDEIKSLRNMAISPLSYLVTPRVLGMTLACIALTIYFQIIAIGTGITVNALRMGASLGGQAASFFEITGFHEITMSLFKSMLFGILVSVVSCYHGLRKKVAATEIPQAVSQAVIRSLMVVFAGDGLVAILVF